MDGYTIDVDNPSGAFLERVTIRLGDVRTLELSGVGAGGGWVQLDFAAEIPDWALVEWKVDEEQHTKTVSLAEWRNPRITEGTLRFVFVRPDQVEVGFYPEE